MVMFIFIFVSKLFFLILFKFIFSYIINFYINMLLNEMFSSHSLKTQPGHIPTFCPQNFSEPLWIWVPSMTNKCLCFGVFVNIFSTFCIFFCYKLLHTFWLTVRKWPHLNSSILRMFSLLETLDEVLHFSS